MKKIFLFIVTIAFLPGVVNGQKKSDGYNVEYRCHGPGKFAMVVEYNNQYYVVLTPDFFQNDWIIRDLNGINFGGPKIMTYLNSSGSEVRAQVQVVSRSQFSYSGSFGARDVCRQVARDTYNIPN